MSPGFSSSREGDTVTLVAKDNGIGFDKQEHPNNHDQNTNLGLLGIAERVDLLNGSFELKSAPGDGTRLIIEVPY